MYVRTCVCMYVRTYVCTYVRTYVCMYVCTYVRTYVCTYVCMYVCIPMYCPHVHNARGKKRWLRGHGSYIFAVNMYVSVMYACVCVRARVSAYICMYVCSDIVHMLHW